MTHRYILEPYKNPGSRYTCPACGKARRFTRYIDSHTSTQLGYHIGKCDREQSCGYHFTPREYFALNPDCKPADVSPPPFNPALLTPDTIPRDLFRQTLKHYQRNHFVQYLLYLFPEDTVQELVESYRIGTSRHWPNATIFWQIDAEQKVRTGKIMLYHPQSGKRIREPFAHIAWAHTLLKLPTAGAEPYNMKQCLFGEHLLIQHPQKLIAIAESEKTAIIAAGYMPQYLWLAAGSLAGLSHQKCQALQGRQVMLFPDTDGFEKWTIRMEQLRREFPAPASACAATPGCCPHPTP